MWQKDKKVRNNNTIEAFFALLRGGLWEKETNLSQYGEIDFAEIYKLAEEQSVVGLIAAGIEHVTDAKIPQAWTLQFIGATLQIEQRNKFMNEFIARIISDLRKVGVYALLVKGQGVAQCYERPLWRACGDVDLFLNAENYFKAFEYLTPLADRAVDNNNVTKHYSMTFGQWEVELHGTMRSRVSKCIDNELDKIQSLTFNNCEVREWRNNNIDVFLPAPNNDVIFIFAHILQHFYHGGIGLRQICDLARLLFKYGNDIDRDLLKKRLVSMKIMKEWKAFGCFLVNYLGVQEEIMPLYDKKYLNKAYRIRLYVLKMGNFGHNKDISYQSRNIPVVRKMKTFFRQASESFILFGIFPRNSTLSLYNYWRDGIMSLSD